MTVKNSLELKGSIGAYPVAETLLEIAQAALTGSLRIEQEEKKAIVYFLEGEAVYSVSNQRVHRLSELLLERNIIDREFMIRNRNVTGDLQFGAAVTAAELMSAESITILIRELCETVIKDTLSWASGEWTFSPNSRLKEGLTYGLDLGALLFSHARTLPLDYAASRLVNQNEFFTVRHFRTDILLSPQEAFLISRLEDGHYTLGQLLEIGGLSRDEVLAAVYILWIGGVLTRSGWNAAFSGNRIEALKTTTFEPRKVKPSVSTNHRPSEQQSTKETDTTDEELPDQGEFDLEQTLQRIESAWNHYQILGIETNVKMVLVRKAYFRLAKMLHPDRYRNEAAEIAKRVEKAFTEIAQAHETLKTPEGRQSYDIKMREIERDRQHTSGDSTTKQEGSAAAEFERGFALQLNGDFEAAVPHLARAVHYSPNNARYHAYYGKALSADESQRLKAQNELLAAIQLEPANPTFRLLLAEFFIRYKLLKRAEGELTRLLETSSDNREAMALLDSIRAKSLN